MACWAVGEGGGCASQDKLSSLRIADDNGIVVTARARMISIGFKSISLFDIVWGDRVWDYSGWVEDRLVLTGQSRGYRERSRELETFWIADIPEHQNGIVIKLSHIPNFWI